MDSRRLTKLLLRVFVVSIVAMALLGIWALAIPDDSWELELKAFATTAVITTASICGLACGGCMMRGHRVLPTAGLILTPISAILLLIALWFEIDSEVFWKTAVSLASFAVACAHLSMLFMADLTGVYRWAYLAAYQLIFGLAALLSVGTIFDFFENDGYWRGTGAISILVAAITLLIPIFHRFSRDQTSTLEAAADPLFDVDVEIGRLKKRLMELESKRRVMLGREVVEATCESKDGAAH
jgi:hypothetical protein